MAHEPAINKATVLSHALALEARTAAGSDPTVRVELVRLYRALGCPSAGAAELGRLERGVEAQHPAVMAEVMRSALDEGKLMPAMRWLPKATAIPNPPAALRLSLARTATAAGQIGAAAEHYAVLVREGPEASVLPHLAEFVCRHCERPAAQSLAAALQTIHPKDSSPALLHYAVARSQSQVGLPTARRSLERIPVDRIAGVRILFDLAVEAFGRAAWRICAACCRRIQALEQAHGGAASLLVSAYTFARRWEPAAETIRQRPGTPPSVLLGPAQVEGLWALVENTRLHRDLVTGLLTDQGVRQTPLEDLSDTDFAHQAGQSQPVTVSVLGPDLTARPGPLTLLREVPTELPHLMIQRLGKRHRSLHAFQPTPACERWPWCEVPLAHAGGPRTRALPGIHLDAAECSAASPANRLWIQLTQEFRHDQRTR